MTRLVLALARGLVRQPGHVSVSERTEDGLVRLVLSVAPDDQGRIIGRRGRTVEALRTLLAAVGKRRGMRVQLEVRP